MIAWLARQSNTSEEKNVGIKQEVKREHEQRKEAQKSFQLYEESVSQVLSSVFYHQISNINIL